MSDFYNRDNFLQDREKAFRGRGRRRRAFFFILIVVLGFGLVFGTKISSTFSRIYTIDSGGDFSTEEEFRPFSDKNRLNVLILGIRGADDPNGGLLTDSIILASVKKDTGETALISFPRDLYVEIPGTAREEKINAAYAIGGLPLARRTLEFVSGLEIDYVASVNFQAFEEFIDAIGGITINLDRDFREGEQWANYPERVKEESRRYWIVNEATGKWQFFLPRGENWLNGEAALYYARARLETSDFDRARRQQQMILAAKDKLLSLGVLANPFRAYKLLDILKDNIRTSADSVAIVNLIKIASEADVVRQFVFDTTEAGLLKEDRLGESFVLLPVSGGYGEIREKTKNIFEF